MPENKADGPVYLALGMAIQVTRQWRFSRQQVIKAEADKVQAELSFLKAQINPHFLFNTLNNIYTLALTKNERTADSIMRLSNIMRYVTDEVTHHLVPLQHEVNCINDFIALQRLRLNRKTQTDFIVEGDLEQKKIAPLLLMPFDEPLALELIQEYVSRFPALNLVHTFDDAISAVEILRNTKIDLLFLDINMPDISGLDLVRSLQQKPLIIFTTAHKQFALEGFELDAVDYLLKPIQIDRFTKAVNKAIDYYKYKNTASNEDSDSLFVHAEYGLVKIPLGEIEYIAAILYP